MMKPYPRRVLLHGERAQVMIIFALVSVVLFAIIGLSIDAGISYLTSDQIERGASASALAGVAYLPGQYGSAQNAALVEAARNGFTNNPNNGVLGFEYPNPTNGEALAKGEFPFFPDTLFFQLAGNRISNNVFAHNGYRGGAFTGDLTLVGGFSEVFGYPESHSVNNCASSNLFSDATFPAKIEGTWGCQNNTTPSPGGGLPAVEYLVGLQLEADAIRAAVPPVGQPAPQPQQTMPNPCAGVPKNPLCR